MGEGIRRKKRRAAGCIPSGFWRTMRRDLGWAPGSWTQTIFRTGGSSCCTHREAKWGFSSQSRSLQFLLFMGACKKRNNKFLGSRFNVCVESYSMSYIPAAEAVLVSLFRVCFQYEWRSSQLRASPRLQTDPRWLAKRSDSSLNSTALSVPLDSTTLQLGPVAINSWYGSPFWPGMNLEWPTSLRAWHNRCVSQWFVFSFNPTSRVFFSFLFFILEVEGCRVRIHLVLKYFYFHSNNFSFNPSASSEVTDIMMSNCGERRRENGNEANMSGSVM